ncbi:unnamed protein product [Caenorhabditis auriculariae]|uniref:G protein-coupled receptor n=1 Tax=Caenorhabditis auriculariae TaxID=2777116 RepID=A0A8S1GSF3_9PELO|nr:unnamed protein product [Caenorhabditis auriculariae]
MSASDIFSNERPTIYIVTGYVIALFGLDILFVLLELTLSTVGVCFIYRHDAAAKLIKKKTVGRWRTLIFFLLTFACSIIDGLLMRHSALSLSEQQEAIQKYYPQAVNMSLENAYFYDHRVNDMILYTLAFAYTFETIGILFLVSLAIRTIKMLNNVTGILSRRTITIQRNVLHSLIAQVHSTTAELFAALCVSIKPLFPIMGAKVWSPIVLNLGLDKNLAAVGNKFEIIIIPLKTKEIVFVSFELIMPTIGVCFIYRHDAAVMLVQYYPQAANMSLDNAYFYEYRINDTIVYVRRRRPKPISRGPILMISGLAPVTYRSLCVTAGDYEAVVTLSSVELFACLCLSPKPLFPVIGAKVWSPVINHFGLDIHLGAYYPQAVNMTLENVYFYEYRINDTILYTILLVYFFESIGGLFLFILSIRTIKILNNVTGTLSRRIVTLQRDVLHSLMAQTLAPLIFICVPVVFCSYVVLLQNFDLDAIVLVSMGMMMVHGTASNIAMIATTPRFREFIKNILWAGVNREPNRVQILGVP